MELRGLNASGFGTLKTKNKTFLKNLKVKLEFIINLKMIHAHKYPLDKSIM